VFRLKEIMIKETSKFHPVRNRVPQANGISNGVNNDLRGWEALEEKLKGRGMSIVEIQEARKSFYDGIEVLSKMFLVCCDPKKNPLV